MAAPIITPGIAPLTATTQEQLLFFLGTAGRYLNDNGLVGDNPTQVVLKYFFKLFTATNDANRQERTTVEKNTGVIGTVPDTGLFDALTGFENRTLFENFVTVAEEGGKYDIIHRNLGKLTQFIGSIKLTKEGMENAAYRFVKEGYGMIVQQDMAAKLYTYVVADLVTLLQAGTTRDIYKAGEKVFQAAAGDVFPFGNLVTASLDEAGVEAVMTNLMQHTDRNGNEIQYQTPKFWMCSKANVIPLRKILFPGVVDNVSFRSSINWDDGIPVIVGLKGLTDNEIYVFCGASGLEMRAETESPFFTLGSDKDLNQRMHIRWILGFGWTSRHGMVKWVIPA